MERLQKLREIMKQNNLDAFLVTSMSNIKYLAAFSGTTGKVLVTMEEQYFLTDFRYISQATKQCVGFKVVDVNNDYANTINKLIDSKTVGFEGDYMTYDNYQYFKTNCPNLLFKSVSLCKLRMLKEENEIAKIIRANEISLEALDYCLANKLVPNKTTEKEFRYALESKMQELGASGPSFDTIIASGVRSSLPHGVASDKVIEDGDFITIDFGCYYEGYVSDITRTFAINRIDPKLKEIYEIVKEAQLIGVNAIKPGVKLKDVDKVVRDYITNKGYGEYFGHGTGHGIGIDIHEEPYVRWNIDEELVPGMVITIEPGIYLPNIGGVRIEDDVLVTENGHKILTNYDKNLKVISK